MDGQLPTIPITRPLVGDAEAEAVARALRSGWLTQGAGVAAFERAVAAYVGARHAIACSSCTTALHLALKVADIGPGDEVIVPSMSFIATANAVRYVGATPVFAEVDPQTYNLDPDATAAAVTPRTRAVLVVHQVGMPAELDRLRELTAHRGLLLVEDGACALGARYRGRQIGGDALLACFSFHPRKVITTGEGGLIATDNQALADRLRRLRQHGMSLNDHQRHESHQVLIEQYDEVGFNYRMTDIQAAIGIEQMKRLDGILQRRRALAERYTQALRHIHGLEPPHVPAWATPNYQSYTVRLSKAFPLGRNELLAALLRRGIAARRGIMTIHREPAYQSSAVPIRLPVTEAASDETLLLPLYPQMTDAEQQRVIEALVAIGGQTHVSARSA